MEGLIDRGEDALHSVAKAIQRATVGHPLFGGAVERPYVIFLDNNMHFSYL
jgi:hypothetical protein